MARAVGVLGATAIAGKRFALEHKGGDVYAIRRKEDGEQVGETVIAKRGERTLQIERLCIERPFRSYGAGSEAAGLIIRAAKKAGYTALRAWAPPDLGLAVYFWARMGLHPLGGDGPGGGIWMERELGSD